VAKPRRRLTPAHTRPVAPFRPAFGDVWFDDLNGRAWQCLDEVARHPSGEPIRRWSLIHANSNRRSRVNRGGRTIDLGDAYVRRYWRRMVAA
jgi:hypothetical protein